MVVRTKLTVAYLGDGFSGWQRQLQARTVQGELEGSLAKLTGVERIVVVGAGRTDAGVHAVAQAAHADLPERIPTSALPKLINVRLGSDLRVRSATKVRADFHAQKDALGKHYAYRIRWREPDLPWIGLRCAVLPRVRAPEALEEACRHLPGRRDWAPFTVPEVARCGAIRTLHRADWVWRPTGLDLHVVGEGFLRYQVRRMVGALLEVGHGRMTTAEFLDLLETPSPGVSVPTAPARGLSLERVYYRASPRLSPAAEAGPSLW
jgi:tRNA pseudouridine38-40 synthase